jgi:solute:Na+ symporter, SSS family
MLDLLIVLAFVAYAVTAGLRARRKAGRGLEEYFLAGRTVKGWQAGTSMAATQFAADTPLLVAGLVATGGIFLVWRLWIYGIAFLLLAFVFSRLWRRARVLTDAELTELRYSGRGVLPLRVLKAIYYGTVINCVVLAMVLVAAVRIAEVFLPWHLWLPGGLYQPVLDAVTWLGLALDSGATGIEPVVATANNAISIVVIVAFTALYSMTGGLRGVIATDVVQFALAMGGTLAYAWFVAREVGGLGALTDRVVELYGEARASELLSFAPGVEEAAFAFLVVIGLQWLFQMNSDGTGYLAQRSMACRTHPEARTAGVVFAWLQIFLRSLLWLVIAVGLLVVYPIEGALVGAAGAAGAGAAEGGAAAGQALAAQREILFVTGIDELLPVGVRGLMLTGLLAALASTIDTHLNWGASYWSRDIYQRLVCVHWLRREPGGRELVVVARLSNLLILGIGLVIMAHLGSIQEAWLISLLFGAGMGSVLVLRWLWERINLHSELAAMVVSLVAAPLFLFGTESEVIRLGGMALVSTIAAVAAAYLGPETDRRTLVAFYRRVRPVGFWSATARAAGREPGLPVRGLLRDARTTLFASLSLFLFLVGVGRLLVPAPVGNGWLPWLLIAAGVAAGAGWWTRAGGPTLGGSSRDSATVTGAPKRPGARAGSSGDERFS